MATIELQDVTKRYDDGTEAVSGLDLEVRDGEFLILVGPSGCGKSTVLRMIAGLEQISDGELRIDGDRVNDRAPKDRNIAMVFQNYALYPHMTVRQNMAFALQQAKVPKREIAERVEEAARALDLDAHLERKPAQLSGGQRQRVAMGRAIVRSPKAFLMDEPLSNLDAKLRVQMRAEVARIQSRVGTTTVYVTHDQTEAMTLGDRVAVMRGGVIQQLDTPAALYERPVNLFVAGFIGSPAMNLLAGRWQGETVRLPFGEVPLPAAVRERHGAAAEPRDVIVGIRPEHVEDAGLVREGGEGRHLRFTARPEVVESLGSELHVHVAVPGPAVQSDQLRELAADAGAGDGAGALVGGRSLVARVDVASRARVGDPLELALDPRRLYLFDPRDGSNLALAG
ncbi:SN-glycerol-3-phosphate transport ATP-binding protein UgpC (TC 3.A.1.1.3) [Patulibacter medicamentivorans]|uniref:SN-glycerol-3-phosphate transport ATP-binding protein UgpC (TC 3.A.1.1.3) n=1 Tax=Patulibacter medicamentivorans TaxID=1097667 RepID=H0E880_9ACTN|nr:sn-glycerol-3-phosphate ABC transporter ATP-binding protein UgpC [Patulibacter medicamentivorans]EHN10145.1 SN-glycerol-3-phosphate transport ATP-binding protein UgpC (TC 3.A.1.1.3) [Patulibacter medicamentivorans]